MDHNLFESVVVAISFICGFNVSFCVEQKCNLPESGRYGNGKPIIPILNERSLPEFLESARMGRPIDRSNNRLKLFSGTANRALSQVSKTTVNIYSNTCLAN